MPGNLTEAVDVIGNTVESSVGLDWAMMLKVDFKKGFHFFIIIL